MAHRVCSWTLGLAIAATGIGATWSQSVWAQEASPEEMPENCPMCQNLPSRFSVSPTTGQVTSAILQEGTDDAAEAPQGMVWVPGGTFTMGSNHPDSWPVERPAHTVTVDGFWMDITEVTNAEFAAFVEATGYVTAAERAPTMEEIMSQLPPGTPEPDPSVLVASSLVFVPPQAAVAPDPRNVSAWWQWVEGADWRHPEGPNSSIEDRMNHPVVHMTYSDALAYCEWAGTRLPTEAEWEFAARGGLDNRVYTWGDEPWNEEAPQANTWQGQFPIENTLADGFARTSPVGRFEPNGYGLHDMAGNAWEWTSDWYRPDTFIRRAHLQDISNPTGPDRSYDPNNPYGQVRVTKGGSYLCHPSYCASYRPSARMASDPTTSLGHTGFRTVVTPAMRAAQLESGN